MKSTYTSTELYHFVGYRAPNDHEANYQILLKILRQRCVSHPPHLSGWGNVTVTIDLTRPLISEKMINPTMTSYADIPFEHLALHGRKYGMFAVSFKRELLIKYGA